MVTIEQALEASECVERNRKRLGNPRPNGFAASFRKRPAHAAGNRPVRVDLLAAQVLNDLLAELAEPDAAAREFAIGRDQADKIAPGGVAVESEDQVRRAKMEKTERMRLNDLRQVHQPPQLDRTRRWRNRHDLITGLGRGDQMADRANPAN